MKGNAMVKFIVFIITSILIAHVSREPLRNPRSHGFYRFFAWEAILALLVLNIDDWLLDPFAPHQIIAWILLILSLYPLIDGVRLLRRIGQPDPNRPDEDLISIEKTTQLVTDGIFKYIRHPLYSSLFFLAWGTFFKTPSWRDLALALAATAFLYITAKIEEGENIKYFGPAYEEYMVKTKMFVPFVF
jgi:protein-S-isoprenylcysteine O-methyltransferase Ste14